MQKKEGKIPESVRIPVSHNCRPFDRIPFLFSSYFLCHYLHHPQHLNCNSCILPHPGTQNRIVTNSQSSAGYFPERLFAIFKLLSEMRTSNSHSKKKEGKR